MGGRGSSSGKATQRASKNSYKITADSHKSDLTGVELSQEQIYEINQKRLQYLDELGEQIQNSRSKYYDDYGDEIKGTKLSYNHEQVYHAALDGDTKNLTKLSYKSLQGIKDKAKRDLFDERRYAATLIRRSGYLVGTGGRDPGGKNIVEAEERMQRYTKAIESINGAMRKKAENYVKKHK